ncbi:hypothetical protein [Dysgonomonas sp. Marseille-P4361]|uniref:hypothetical protein n=1 Tax=Dysgonomonas sp. Marseille-P4361 TaxID=2161820 RepID=UPI000D55AD7A|nr:hypothetical protein [Dysgonomonas sp. Marseille-P4361]
MKIRELILNPYFIVGLIVLLLNDFYLKYEYGNFITGKLSDFAGLLIFPMFVATIVPRLNKSISLLTGLGFILWKLPLFTPVIDFINQYSFVTVYRTIDYSDYIALCILPLSHYLINHQERYSILNFDKIRSYSKYALLGISFFAFCATSVPLREMPQGTIFIGDSYKIKLPKDSVISSIKRLGYNCDFHERDTTKHGSISFYQTDNIIQYYQDSIVLDTIASMKYELEELNSKKTKLTIINITFSKEGNIQNWKTLKSMSKTYSSWLKDNLIEKIE